VDRSTLRIKLVEGIDNALAHTWVITGDNRTLLTAARQAFATNDAAVDAVNAALPPDFGVSLFTTDVLGESQMAKQPKSQAGTAPNMEAVKAKLQSMGMASDLIQKLLAFLQSSGAGPIIIQVILQILTGILKPGPAPVPAQLSGTMAQCPDDHCTCETQALQDLIDRQVQALAISSRLLECHCKPDDGGNGGGGDSGD